MRGSNKKYFVVMETVRYPTRISSFISLIFNDNILTVLTSLLSKARLKLDWEISIDFRFPPTPDNI